MAHKYISQSINDCGVFTYQTQDLELRTDKGHLMYTHYKNIDGPDEHVYVDYLRIMDDYQRQGFGTQLVKELLARTNGNVYLVVEGLDYLPLYQNLGFEYIEKERRNDALPFNYNMVLYRGEEAKQ